MCQISNRQVKLHEPNIMTVNYLLVDSHLRLRHGHNAESHNHQQNERFLCDSHSTTRDITHCITYIHTFTLYITSLTIYSTHIIIVCMFDVFRQPMRYSLSAPKFQISNTIIARINILTSKITNLLVQELVRKLCSVAVLRMNLNEPTDKQVLLSLINECPMQSLCVEHKRHTADVFSA